MSYKTMETIAKQIEKLRLDIAQIANNTKSIDIEINALYMEMSRKPVNHDSLQEKIRVLKDRKMANAARITDRNNDIKQLEKDLEALRNEALQNGK